MSIKNIKTKPFFDQKPGTSGLRKKVTDFQKKNYLENYIQSIFNASNNSHGNVLIIGGDGRFYNKKAIQIILKMAAANKIKKCVVGKNGILSTPAASNLICKNNAWGGIILTASHNPAGKNGDFGIKFNSSNGGPSSERMNINIYDQTKIINEYKIFSSDDLDLSKISDSMLHKMEVSIIDPVEDYCILMKNLFDFEMISKFIHKGFTMKFDAMHAVTGPYAKEIFENVLNLPIGTVLNYEPLEDFGGEHPDPSPNKIKEKFSKSDIRELDLIASSDGDGDRNLVMGKNIFVSPSDSLALLAANAHLIPAFPNGINGVARSLPTSKAIDVVAKKIGVKCYETPTGWKFFSNLLDKNLINLCGEESFGTGSNHVAEKDGIWAVLAWINLLAVTNLSIPDLLKRHWNEFGRHYYLRFDYIIPDEKKANKLMDALCKKINFLSKEEMLEQKITSANEFIYTDITDKSIYKNQIFQIKFIDDARIIFRQSGTETKGSTLRVYFEKFDLNSENYDLDKIEVCSEIINFAKKFARIKDFTGKNGPDFIT